MATVCLPLDITRPCGSKFEVHEGEMTTAVPLSAAETRRDEIILARKSVFLDGDRFQSLTITRHGLIPTRIPRWNGDETLSDVR